MKTYVMIMATGFVVSLSACLLERLCEAGALADVTQRVIVWSFIGTVSFIAGGVFLGEARS